MFFKYFYGQNKYKTRVSASCSVCTKQWINVKKRKLSILASNCTFGGGKIGKIVKINCICQIIYRKVANRSIFCLVAPQRIFRPLMKRKFDVYLLWPFGEGLIFAIVVQFTVGNSTVVRVYINLDINFAWEFEFWVECTLPPVALICTAAHSLLLFDFEHFQNSWEFSRSSSKHYLAEPPKAMGEQPTKWKSLNCGV